jgi:hypothetical protein
MSPGIPTVRTPPDLGSALPEGDVAAWGLGLCAYATGLMSSSRAMVKEETWRSQALGSFIVAS